MCLSAVCIGCSKDDENNTLETMTYTLHAVSNPNISGKVVISENADGSATVRLSINGSSTDIHPAYIYHGSETQAGAIAITLTPIECACESSTMLVTKLDNGTAINYKGLKSFSGHIKIHQRTDQIGTIIAMGNIGINAQ